VEKQFLETKYSLRSIYDFLPTVVDLACIVLLCCVYFDIMCIVFIAVLYTLVAGLLARGQYIRKVLRPATSAQVFLGFPVPISKC